MHYDFRNHASEEETEQAKCESEIRPIMPILHSLQGIPFKVNLPIEIHLMERLHWDLRLAMISCPILLVLEMQVMLHWTAWVSSFLILARRDGGGNVPECNENGDASKESEESPSEEAAMYLACKVARY